MTSLENFKNSLEFQVIEELCGRVRWTDDWLEFQTEPDRLPAVCEALTKAGGVFDSAFQTSTSGTQAELCYVFRLAALPRLALVSARGTSFSPVSDRIDAASWDERKLSDLCGISFSELPDPRPLLAHPESGWAGCFPKSARTNRAPVVSDSSTYAHEAYPIPGTGKPGEFEIPVGPVHAGIIEPGHFRFFVGGEPIFRMETRMFYLHKGLERQAQGKPIEQVVPLMEQASGDESVANALAFCQAVERIGNANVPPRAEALRLVLAELERFYSHLSDLGGMAMDVGYYASSSQFAALREGLMRQNELLCGNRFLRGQVVPGGLGVDLKPERLHALAEKLQDVHSRLLSLESMTFSSSTFLDRVFTAGRVLPATVSELALVGPVARASGVSCDVRKQFPYGWYRNVEVSEALAGTGDVLARFTVKTQEVKESLRLLGHVLRHLPKGAVRKPVKNASGTGVSLVEAPRGAVCVLVRAQSGKIQRLAVRTASFRNWRGLEKAVLGNIVPDFPLINKSFNLSYSGTDL